MSEQMSSDTQNDVWSLGYEDRGMGRFSYAVLRGLPEDQDIVVECGDDKKLAEQIINDHNAARTFPSERAYICKCGIRVEPHRCNTESEF